MTLAAPSTYVKQWDLHRNINSSTSNVQTVLDRWTHLQTFASRPWVAVKSCNGTTVASGNILTVTGDWTLGNAAGSNARSWGLLQNTMGRQLLYDYRGTNSANVVLRYSPRGLYTGGSPTAPPTATDELRCADVSADPASAVIDPGGGSPQRYQHIWHSLDGKQTMMLATSNGIGSTHLFWFFGELEDPNPAYLHPCVLWGGGWTAGPLVGASTNQSVTGEGNNTPGEISPMRFAMEGINVGTYQPFSVSGTGISIKNELSAKWDVFGKMWLMAETNNYALGGGAVGYWPDMYPAFPSQTGFVTGDHIPASGAFQWVKVYDLWLPWPGGAAMTVG